MVMTFSGVPVGLLLVDPPLVVALPPDGAEVPELPVELLLLDEPQAPTRSAAAATTATTPSRTRPRCPMGRFWYGTCCPPVCTPRPGAFGGRRRRGVIRVKCSASHLTGRPG